MGYYTSFKMVVLENGQEVNEIQFPEFSNVDLDQGSLSISSLIEHTSDSCKWYDHEEEMIEYSKKFPQLVFILDGDGEEAGDVWREFYKNGKTYRWELEVVRPNFNAKKLK